MRMYVDKLAEELWVDDKYVYLTPTEWAVFIALYERGRESTPTWLLADLARTTPNAAKIIIRQIRNKISQDFIESRELRGYRIKQESHKLVM